MTSACRGPWLAALACSLVVSAPCKGQQPAAAGDLGSARPGLWEAAPAGFGQCAVCHSTDGSLGAGPTLKGVFGRKAGSVAGFRYSRAMRAAGIVWDEGTLDRYLANPQDVVPGNLMPFSGVPDSAQRAAVIDYLKTLK